MNVKAKVDIYIEKQNKWSDGLQKIRAILLSTELDEEIKRMMQDKKDRK